MYEWLTSRRRRMSSPRGCLRRLARRDGRRGPRLPLQQRRRGALGHYLQRTSQRGCASTNVEEGARRDLASSSRTKPRSSTAFSRCANCPAVSKEDWPDVISRFVKRLPVLVERSRNVAGADARAALVDAVAEPCLYLAAQKSAHAAFSSEIDPAAAFSKADHVGTAC